MTFFQGRVAPLFLGVLFFYLIMAFGGVFYFLSSYSFFLLSLALVFSCLLLFGSLANVDVDLRLPVFFLLFMAMFLLFGALRSNDAAYALEKIDSFVVVTFLATILAIKIVRFYGQDRFWYAFLCASFLILVLTVIFKLKFGLFDRSVRFFINGPIVFGWLMGFSSLIAYHFFVKRRKLLFLCLSGTFFVAVLWTLSKGPLMALVFSLLFLSLGGRSGRIALTLIFILLAIVIFVFNDFLSDFLLESRFSAIGRLLQGSSGSSDWGSIGIRQEMLVDSFEKFIGSPLFGIGLGNYTFQHLFYPHNEHAEVFLELGVFAGIFHVGVLVWMLMKSDHAFRSFILFFIICTSFSGDLGYLRFVYVIGFLGVFVRGSVVRDYGRELSSRNSFSGGSL